ncbi:MAG: alpha/beta fold hydrolase [Myxococcota bacterium]
MQIVANRILIDYEEVGPRDAPALVLIRGLGTQRIQWPEPFLAGLAARGLRVVSFDNRDVGESTKFDKAGPADVAGAMARVLKGEPVDPPYRLDDMARDVIGLLDALEIERAHVVGISMGGMIAQLVAVNHGERVRSLVSAMSSSGHPDLPPARPEAMRALTSQPRKPGDRDSVIEHSIEVHRVLEGSGFIADEADVRDLAGRRFDRCYYPDGVARQLVAVLANRGRFEMLEKISVPTLVIHGEDDPLVPVECGIDTARRIPGARLKTIKGMGHTIPLGVVPTLVDAIADHAQAADAAEPGS